jgi:uncharacterized membrane protein YedE/YeeE
VIAPLTTAQIAAAIAGGLLIGAAAGLFLLLSGRIAGVSGLAARSLQIADKGPPWIQATAFVIGLPAGAMAVAAAVGTPQLGITSSVPLLVAGGLLVGFGTRLGNGCTSGHGVCGLARLSRRSIAATGTFMAAGFATVFIMRHLVRLG